jgi:hypothetical protein
VPPSPAAPSLLPPSAEGRSRPGIFTTPPAGPFCDGDGLLVALGSLGGDAFVALAEGSLVGRDGSLEHAFAVAASETSNANDVPAEDLKLMCVGA